MKTHKIIDSESEVIMNNQEIVIIEMLKEVSDERIIFDKYPVYPLTEGTRYGALLTEKGVKVFFGDEKYTVFVELKEEEYEILSTPSMSFIEKRCILYGTL